MSLSTLVVSCAVGLLAHPFNSFTILSWNQPASFVATFARRRIESVLDFFKKELLDSDSFNTRQYYWFNASLRAVSVGMLYRGVLMWTATGAFSLSPTIPNWIRRSVNFVRSKISNNNGPPASTTAALIENDSDDQDSRNNRSSKNTNNDKCAETDRILGYTLSRSTGAVVRATFRSLVTGAASIATSPLQIVIIIFVADISKGYPDLFRAWRGLKASCFCDWEREHPHYEPGDNPWLLKKRPHMAWMIWSKLSKQQVLESAIFPLARYAMLHSLVSSGVQFLEAWWIARKKRSDNGSSSSNRSNSETEEEEDLISLLIHNKSKLTPRQKINRFVDSVSTVMRIFVLSTALHGLISYNMSQSMSTAIQNICRMTDYAQPYQKAGGMASIADPLIMRVPKITLFFGISDGVFWGVMTTLVTMWR